MSCGQRPADPRVVVDGAVVVAGDARPPRGGRTAARASTWLRAVVFATAVGSGAGATAEPPANPPGPNSTTATTRPPLPSVVAPSSRLSRGVPRGATAHGAASPSSTARSERPLGRNRGPERYTAKASADARRQLDANGRAIPLLEDEVHENGAVPTTWAVVDDDAGLLVVGLDNAAYKSRGYEGLSKGERAFAWDMARYGHEQGLTVVLAAHVPPTSGHRAGTYLPGRKARARLVAWMNALRERYPDTLWVHGHAHPDRNVALDLDGALGGDDVGGVVLAGQVRDSFTKLVTYADGRVLEEHRVEGRGRRRRTVLVQRTVLARDGRVLDDGADVGAARGVLYCFSDLQKKAGFKAYFAAIGDDAGAAQAQGLSVGYLYVGDHTVVGGRLPVTLPRGERLLFVPGNHDYYDHDSLADVVEALRP
jgi:hypothetical protein